MSGTMCRGQLVACLHAAGDTTRSANGSALEITCLQNHLPRSRFIARALSGPCLVSMRHDHPTWADRLESKSACRHCNTGIQFRPMYNLQAQGSQAVSCRATRNYVFSVLIALTTYERARALLHCTLVLPPLLSGHWVMSTR